MISNSVNNHTISMNMSNTKEAVSTIVQKKSMDIARESASAIINSVSPPSGSAPLPIGNKGLNFSAKV